MVLEIKVANSTFSSPEIWVVAIDHIEVRFFRKKQDDVEEISKIRTKRPLLLQRLSEAKEKKHFDHLILMAAPQILIKLRHTIPKSMRKHIIAEFERDLTELTKKELFTHLKRVLWF